MTADIRFNEVAPILPVVDLRAALERFARLGFVTRAYSEHVPYGFADRDLVSIHLTEVADHDPATSDVAIYLYVSDADALYAAWRAAGVDGRFIEPTTTEYELREFAYVDPDGILLRVGSRLAPKSD